MHLIFTDCLIVCIGSVKIKNCAGHAEFVWLLVLTFLNIWIVAQSQSSSRSIVLTSSRINQRYVNPSKIKLCWNLLHHDVNCSEAFIQINFWYCFFVIYLNNPHFVIFMLKNVISYFKKVFFNISARVSVFFSVLTQHLMETCLLNHCGIVRCANYQPYQPCYKHSMFPL